MFGVKKERKKYLAAVHCTERVDRLARMENLWGTDKAWKNMNKIERGAKLSQESKRVIKRWGGWVKTTFLPLKMRVSKNGISSTVGNRLEFFYTKT